MESKFYFIEVDKDEKLKKILVSGWQDIGEGWSRPCSYNPLPEDGKIFVIELPKGEVLGKKTGKDWSKIEAYRTEVVDWYKETFNE